MLDTETKRRIDTARDILVGKVPDPKSQVEQITIALIYKFMDDMDLEAEELGGKRKFFAGEFARYSWAKIMSPSLGGHEMLGLYAEGISKMPENAGIPPLFRDIFKNAYLPYRDPETLKSFLKIIDDFSYDHSERLGDAYEYLLSVLGSQGDAGQFRTPRHIIDFIVKVIDPKKGDSVLDPACGTAGFLISSYKHILQSNTDEVGNITLTPDERGRLAQNFKGYDISPDMVRLSLVNLYLHGFTAPHIYEYDTLTSEERWNEYADVILANPPFMTPKGGIRPHNQFSVKSKRSEVLFLDYIIEHLTPIGKAGVIVPEGVHFVAQSGHTELRNSLINNNFLLADITLPHGVFKPYASVKTHILIIDKHLSPKTPNVLFIEVENDGFTQSDTREPVEGSELDEAIFCLNNFKKSIIGKESWHSSHYALRAYQVSKKNLLSTEEKHILGRWHDLPNRVIHKPDLRLEKIGAVCEIKDGLSPNMSTLSGDFPLVVPAAEQKTADHWDYEGKAVCVPLVSAAGHGKADIKRLHYQEGKFALATTMCAIFSLDTDLLNPRFLHLFLSASCLDLLVPLMCGATNVTMNSTKLKDVLVPIPNSDIQNHIVESHLIENYTRNILRESELFQISSKNKENLRLSKALVSEVEKFLKSSKLGTSINQFLPKKIS